MRTLSLRLRHHCGGSKCATFGGKSLKALSRLRRLAESAIQAWLEAAA